jgi:hypothetical protein
MSNLLLGANIDNALIEQVKYITGITDEKTVIEKALQFFVENQSHFPKKQPRILGLHEGKGWMSEGFDEALSDEFWLGKE